MSGARLIRRTLENGRNYYPSLLNLLETGSKRLGKIPSEKIVNRYAQSVNWNLRGPCDALIHGETAEEMMENSKKHAMEMAAKGDEIHINTMKAMGEMHQSMDEAAVKQWMEKFQNDFDVVPEDK